VQLAPKNRLQCSNNHLHRTWRWSIQVARERFKSSPTQYHDPKSSRELKTAREGAACGPSSTADDKKKNLRLDAGSWVGDKYEVIVQPNKNANDPSVKKAAQSESHQILAKGTVNQDCQEEDVKNDLLESFQETKK
jgi:hypothetical protein